MHVVWKFTGDGILAFAGGACAIIAVLLSNRRSRINLQRQIDAEKKAREEESKRERYGTAAVLRSEIASIWEVDLRSFSSTMEKVPELTGTKLLSNGASLPAVPSRYFPVFERCAGKG